MVKQFSKTVAVRVNKDLYKLIVKLTKARGEDVSDFVRRAIYKELAHLNYLPREQKKALGMEAKP